MSVLPSHLDRDGFAKYFALMQQGSDVLTTYILTIANQAGWDVPDAARSRMMAALEAFVQGRVQRDSEWRQPIFRFAESRHCKRWRAGDAR